MTVAVAAESVALIVSIASALVSAGSVCVGWMMWRRSGSIITVEDPVFEPETLVNDDGSGYEWHLQALVRNVGRLAVQVECTAQVRPVSEDGVVGTEPTVFYPMYVGRWRDYGSPISATVEPGHQQDFWAIVSAQVQTESAGLHGSSIPPESLYRFVVTTGRGESYHSTWHPLPPWPDWQGQTARRD